MTESLPTWVREALRCPETHAELDDAPGPHGHELVSRDPVEKLAYPVKSGIPILLVEDSRHVD